MRVPLQLFPTLIASTAAARAFGETWRSHALRWGGSCFNEKGVICSEDEFTRTTPPSTGGACFDINLKRHHCHVRFPFNNKKTRLHMFLWRPLEKPVGEQYEDVQTHAPRISHKAHSNFSRVSIPYKQTKCCIQLYLNTSTLRHVLQAH